MGIWLDKPTHKEEISQFLIQLSFSHRCCTNMRMSFSSNTAFSGSQVAPLRVHIRKATSRAFERSNTSSFGMHLKKVKKFTQPADERRQQCIMHNRGRCWI